MFIQIKIAYYILLESRKLIKFLKTTKIELQPIVWEALLYNINKFTTDPSLFSNLNYENLGKTSNIVFDFFF